MTSASTREAFVPRTAAAIVAWRQAEITMAAVRSATAMAPGAELLICVVMEWTAAQLDALSAAAPPGTVVIAEEDNLGFAAAANRALGEASRRGMEWVLLLNNDATVSASCLDECVREAARHPRLAVIGPAIVFADHPDRLWYAGGKLNSLLGYTRHAALRRPVAQMPPSDDTDYVTGCCALVSVAAWETLGPYREDYFLYFEDPEWCDRARRAGWRCRYLARVLCEHAVSGSTQRGSLGLSPTTAYYLARNPVRFAMESRAVLRATRLAGLAVVWNAYNAWRILRSPQPREVARAYLRGWRDGLVGRMGREGSR